jgi:GNAT superfamily N-acetyltransferase
MCIELKNLVRLNKFHAKSATEVLSQSFQNDQSLKHYFPDELARKRIAPYLFSVIVLSGIQYGEAYATSPNLEGVAVWISSDNYPITYWGLLRSVPLSTIFFIGMYGGFRMRSVRERTDAVHKRLAPFKHWFLQIIGVDPKFQGKGYAGKLLKPMLARIDEEGLPCYLDTLNEINVTLYEHFGFKIIEKAIIPQTSFTNLAMLREATTRPR